MLSIFIADAKRGFGLEYVHQYTERVYASCRRPGETETLIAPVACLMVKEAQANRNFILGNKPADKEDQAMSG